MRRFLLFLGSLLLGTVTIGVTLGIVAGPTLGRIGMLVVVWLVGVLAAMILGAPFFTRPPGAPGVLTLRVPGALRVPVMVIRGVAWMGMMLLWGFWELVFLAWDPRPGKATRGKVRPGP